MKVRERQSPEFTSPPSPKTHVPVRKRKVAKHRKETKETLLWQNCNSGEKNNTNLGENTGKKCKREDLTN